MTYTAVVSSLNVVFCGTSAFAVPSLRALCSDPTISVQLVISQPDRPVGRKQVLTPSPLAQAAKDLHVPLLQPENINTAMPELLARVTERPDFLVVVAYGQILRPTVLEWPTQMPMNVHGSLLPRWRGASPVHQAVLHGDVTSGVTVQRMVAALDAGPVLSQVETPIAVRETFTTLHDRLAEMGATLLLQTLKHPLREAPQDESQVTVCHTLKREDGVVDINTLTAIDIDRRVRALNPWPSVTLEHLGETVKVLEADLEPTAESIPLPCANNTILHLQTVQPASKKPMSAAAWLRGKK
jgi:methionyl-tRNA formyltransferase